MSLYGRATHRHRALPSRFPPDERVVSTKAIDDVIPIPACDGVVSACAKDAEISCQAHAHVRQKRISVKLVGALSGKVDKQLWSANSKLRRRSADRAGQARV